MTDHKCQCKEREAKIKEYKKLIEWANDKLWKAVAEGLHENEIYESGQDWIDHPLVKEIVEDIEGGD